MTNRDDGQRTTSRRAFLAAGASLPALLAFKGWPLAAAEPRKKLPVAAVVTIYTPKSHTDVLIGKILEGWQHDGGSGPDLTLASMYVDQYPSQDVARSMAAKHGFRLAKTIDEAITLGTDKVQVAGVISIGEHGNYPLTPDTKQQMYPRKRFFDEIVAAMDRCGKYVPVFNDKHLAWKWDDAKAMYDVARQKKIPFLAGSSVPVAWRKPLLELDRQAEVESAVTIACSELERYGFHALEIHEALLERRRGGEAGIVAVQALQGAAIHKAAAEERWPVGLFEKALAALPGNLDPGTDWTKQSEAALFLLEHRDGLKSAVVMSGTLTPEFAFAAKLKGQAEPVSTWISLQNFRPFGHFAQLLKAIEETIHSGQAVFPVERTLLTTGALDRLMHSLAQNGARLETPELAIAYQPSDWPYANHRRTRLELPDFTP